jgi:colanic acid/amylovoran biosynthesis protein
LKAEKLKQGRQQKRALIVHAILTNNGDAALVMALFNQLESAGYSCSIATLHYDKIKQHYPSLPLEPDWNSSWWCIKLPFLRKWVAIWQFKWRASFKKADLVVGCPGGYMNSFYGFSHKLTVFRLAKKLGKKTAIYAQSFGPLDQKGEADLKNGAEYLDVLMARDNRSMETLENLGLGNLTIRSNDAAFSLPPESPQARSGRIAFSVRDWKFDARNQMKYEALVTSMAAELIKKGFAITFLSTCQGIEGYVNDSATANRICGNLPAEIRTRVEVDTAYYNLDQLRKKLSEFELIVGTRLHMCILSLMSGVPAFNISYEFKGKELYDYIGWSQWSVDYNEEANVGATRLGEFIEQRAELAVNSVVEKQQLSAMEAFSSFLERIQ